jgi:hypothetical protein
MEAQQFSDDHKRTGAYTIRVFVHATNDGAAAIGVQYEESVRLALPNGSEIAPKFISVNPVALPHTSEDGFFDFPVSSQVPLSSLTLQLASGSIPFLVASQ